jgi:uncharacterized protein YlaN (UPF0358 family)
MNNARDLDLSAILGIVETESGKGFMLRLLKEAGRTPQTSITGVRH